MDYAYAVGAVIAMDAVALRVPAVVVAVTVLHLRPAGGIGQFRSKRSSSMTFTQAATKSLTNFSLASSLA